MSMLNPRTFALKASTLPIPPSVHLYSTFSTWKKPEFERKLKQSWWMKLIASEKRTRYFGMGIFWSIFFRHNVLSAYNKKNCLAFFLYQLSSLCFVLQNCDCRCMWHYSSMQLPISLLCELWDVADTHGGVLNPWWAWDDSPLELMGYVLICRNTHFRSKFKRTSRVRFSNWISKFTSKLFLLADSILILRCTIPSFNVLLLLTAPGNLVVLLWLKLFRFTKHVF